MKFIPNNVSAVIGRQILQTKKHSPTILFAGGIAGVVTSTVLACRATLKVDEVLKETQDKMRSAKELAESDNPNYSEADYKKDLTYLYVRGSVRLVKLYGPAFILGVTSIAALAGSHNILSKRNAALTAAYATIESAYAEYRKRVVDELGEEKDREFRFGVEEHTLIEETSKGHKKVQVKRAKDVSDYARIFDQTNRNWQPTPEYNEVFLRAQQQYANDRLRSKGHLTLNDVYDALGFERSKAGFVVGWLWDKEKGKDRHVDFGLGDWPSANDFINGSEHAVLLDFNVDGVIYDKI